MRNFIDIVETHLNETGAGPARVTAHIRNGSPFFMISACKADLDEDMNKKRTAILKSKLAELPGVSFIEVDGIYQEDGQEEPTSEDSFFVMPRSKTSNVEKFLTVGKKLMGAFDQQAILTGNGEEVMLRFADGSTEDVGSTATFDLASVKNMPNHSSVKQRPFGFTTADKAPKGVPYGIDRNKPERAYC